MTKFVVSSDLGRELTGLHECVALCDNSGKTIGFFTPALTTDQASPQVSESELARREREDSTFTLDQVMARLRSL